MRILAITFEPDAGPGVFADAARNRGARVDVWLVPEGGPPSDPTGYDAVMSFGGSMHAHEEDRHAWLRTQKELHAQLLALEVPLLGVCLGAQIACEAAGGQVRKMEQPEIQWADVRVTDDGAGDDLLGPMVPGFKAFEWHSYECLPPEDSPILAASDRCVQAFRLGPTAWAIQFHAEVSSLDSIGWIAQYGKDAESVRAGLDPDAFRAETSDRIAGWNELGRALCDRFLDAAAIGVTG